MQNRVYVIGERVASETVLGVDNAKSGICYIICMDSTYAL